MVEIPEGRKTRPAWGLLDCLGGRRRVWPPRLGPAVMTPQSNLAPPPSGHQAAAAFSRHGENKRK
jgi:hypothetical protein